MLVASVLLAYNALRPGAWCPVRDQLLRAGVAAERWEIHNAVEELRSRGFVIDARAGMTGYRFIDFARVPLLRGFRRRRAAVVDQIALV
jgi:hypothetical protein